MNLNEHSKLYLQSSHHLCCSFKNSFNFLSYTNTTYTSCNLFRDSSSQGKAVGGVYIIKQIQGFSYKIINEHKNVIHTKVTNPANTNEYFALEFLGFPVFQQDLVSSTLYIISKQLRWG